LGKFKYCGPLQDWGGRGGLKKVSICLIWRGKGRIFQGEPCNLKRGGVGGYDKWGGVLRRKRAIYANTSRMIKREYVYPGFSYYG